VSPLPPLACPDRPPKIARRGEEIEAAVPHAEDMNRTLILAFLAVTMLGSVSGAQAASGSRTAKPHHTRVHHTGTRAARTAIARVDSRNPVTTAAAVAESYWGAVPCGGHVTLLADRPLVAGLSSSTDGWVMFNSSLGPDNLSAPATSYTSCVITLAHWRWTSWTDMESDWGMFCLTVVHEMGHLLGHKHSLVPGSVMAPVFTSDANVPAACNATWLPGWRSAATAS
jgi:hypothetical protein